MAPNLATDAVQQDGVDQLIAETLMIPFSMVVIEEFCHRSMEVSLAEWNHAIETLLFDRPHEAPGVCIGVVQTADWNRSSRVSRFHDHTERVAPPSDPVE